jgi:beta-glucosidase
MSESSWSTNRRQFLALAGGSALSAAAGPSLQAKETNQEAFPTDFLWGAATAGHQVEGNNVNSDFWLLENIKPTLFAERSGDACDSYHRYKDDIALLKTLGFNTYRFSIEWSRIEPEHGMFSNAELDHYQRMMQACHAHGLKTVVTFSHFSLPRWFAALGAWENPTAPDFFGKYCSRAAAHLSADIDFALTMNEPNAMRLVNWLKLPPQFKQLQTEMRNRAATVTGSAAFSGMFAGDPDKMLAPMIASHLRGMDAIKAVRSSLPVGVSLAMTDEQAVGANSKRDAMQADVYGAWFEAAAKCDFLGLQTYTRNRLDANGLMAKPEGVELTQVGDEFYPEALEATIRYAYKATGKPIYVTENGIPTKDDTRRIEYIRRALIGVQNCLKDGLPVHSYIHWSLLDNFEWSFGFEPKYGLVACDRETFKRTIKPSARYLGSIARENRLPRAT